MIPSTVNVLAKSSCLFINEKIPKFFFLPCFYGFLETNFVLFQTAPNTFINSYIFRLLNEVHGNSLQDIGTFRIDATLHEPKPTRHLDKEPIYLLILVSSSPFNSDLRAGIRNSWGNCSNYNSYFVHRNNAAKVSTKCRLFFYMGRNSLLEEHKLNEKEMERHGDIIIGDFTDSYHNMTRKMLYAFNWASSKFSMQYILKTDDDVYMNVPKLIYLLETKYSHVKDLYGGHTYYTSVNRDRTHRHYLSKYEYPDYWYPPYNKGAQLIISGHLIRHVITMSSRIHRFQIDDAYLGLLMNRLQVRPTKVGEFVQNQLISHMITYLRSCDLESMVGIGDSLRPAQMIYAHKIVHGHIPWHCVHYRVLCICLLFLCVVGVTLFLYIRRRHVSKSKHES